MTYYTQKTPCSPHIFVDVVDECPEVCSVERSHERRDYRAMETILDGKDI
jgi:hypothetical protein